MKENEFRNWLIRLYDSHTVNSRVSNCKRVESFEGDLDDHYASDKGQLILSKLSYSRYDQLHQISPKHRIPIDGNKYTGTSTFKSAVNLYFKYLSEKSFILIAPNIQKTNSRLKVVKKQVNKNKNDWPNWEIPDDDELFSLISTVLRYVKFLSPEIVGKITEDNNTNRQEWRNLLITNNIDPDIYLWENSPCAFPGIRRHAGAEEIADFKKKGKSSEDKKTDAFCVDDNSFPKEIWSFVFRGKKFQNFGPNEYSLAHLADHKEYKNRVSEDFKILPNVPITKLFGLYTCPTNTVFIPTNLIRPTDFSAQIRKILINKSASLYGNICKIIPPWLELIQEPDDKWNHKKFTWSDPVGTVENLEDFLCYRKETIEKFGKHQ